MAPIICAGLTVYKGLKETEAKPGEWVAISGIGGLGHFLHREEISHYQLIKLLDFLMGELKRFAKGKAGD